MRPTTHFSGFISDPALNSSFHFPSSYAIFRTRSWPGFGRGRPLEREHFDGFEAEQQDQLWYEAAANFSD